VAPRFEVAPFLPPRNSTTQLRMVDTPVIPTTWEVEIERIIV
jgi:hypothetical protein